MEAPRRYPLGVQVFEDIRTQGYLYVDKTAYIWDMIRSGGKYRFLSRPRRFGKTLLGSTLEAYFQGRRELFEGLAIERLDSREIWPAHPVIRLDLSTVKSDTEEGLGLDLDAVLRRAERQFKCESDIQGWSPRVEALISAAHGSEGGEHGVVILVDEYDAPLPNVMHDPERLERFRTVMREFYAPLKASESKLALAFLTGITKFSQLSIFSELNNIQVMSPLPRYAGICGITDEELDTAMAPDVAWLAGRLGVSPERCRELLRERYDGYHFSRNSPDIYNPFSLMSSLNNEQLDDHWFSTGTPTALVAMLRDADVSIPDLERIDADASEFDAPTECMGNPVAFM